MPPKELEALVDWLCAATTEVPKPHRVSGMSKPVRNTVKKWNVSDSVLAYLEKCIPSHGLDLCWFALLDSADIEFFSHDDLVEVCAQGFLPIALETAEGDPYLLDIESGMVHLFSHERVCPGYLFEVGQRNTPVSHENIVRLAQGTFPNLLAFLDKLKSEIEETLPESFWYTVAGGMDLAPSSTLYVPELECARQLRFLLSTPIDAKALRDENGLSLLEVARDRGRPATVPILEAYWENPESFKIYAGGGC